MRQSERIAQLYAENTALKQKLEARVRLDILSQLTLPDAVSAVSKNLSALKQEERLRVLLAVAVLYGIIKPGERDAEDVGGGKDG